MDAVFDRTLLDVQRAKELRDKIISVKFENLTESEKQEWLNGMKGSIKHTDMNRIESNLQTISDKCGFGFVQKTDWGIGDLPTIIDIQRIYNNTRIVKESGFAWKNTNTMPTEPINSYTKINSIEKILLDSFEFAELQDIDIEYIDEIYDETEIVGDDTYYPDNELSCDDDFII
jgi:hypothetical protein